MNPMALMHLKPMIEQFRARHPKFVQFFGFAGSQMTQGTLLEISIVAPDGTRTKTNIRVTQEDIELFRTFRGLVK